jgi:hypothetical protein
MYMESVRPKPAEWDALMARVEAEHRRLAPLLPDIDPGDLHSILTAILRPWGMGRHFLLRRVRPGVNVL